MTDNQIRWLCVALSALISGGITYAVTHDLGITALAAAVAALVAILTCGLAVALFDWID